MYFLGYNVIQYVAQCVITRYLFDPVYFLEVTIFRLTFFTERKQ